MHQLRACGRNEKDCETEHAEENACSFHGPQLIAFGNAPPSERVYLSA